MTGAATLSAPRYSCSHIGSGRQATCDWWSAAICSHTSPVSRSKTARRPGPAPFSKSANTTNRLVASWMLLLQAFKWGCVEGSMGSAPKGPARIRIVRAPRTHVMRRVMGHLRRCAALSTTSGGHVNPGRGRASATR